MRLWKPKRRSRRAGSQVPYFVRILLPGFHAAFPLDPAILGIGAAPRVLCPHVEPSFTSDIRWRLLAAQYQCGGCPLVMRVWKDGWRVLILSYERISESR